MTLGNESSICSVGELGWKWDGPRHLCHLHLYPDWTHPVGIRELGVPQTGSTSNRNDGVEWAVYPGGCSDRDKLLGRISWA